MKAKETRWGVRLPARRLRQNRISSREARYVSLWTRSREGRPRDKPKQNSGGEAPSRRLGLVRGSHHGCVAALFSFVVAHIGLGLDPIRVLWNSGYHHKSKTKVIHG